MVMAVLVPRFVFRHPTLSFTLSSAHTSQLNLKGPTDRHADDVCRLASTPVHRSTKRRAANRNSSDEKKELGRRKVFVRTESLAPLLGRASAVEEKENPQLPPQNITPLRLLQDGPS